MFGQHFYNESTRRYVAVFGTLFNDIQIGRSNNAGTEIQRMTVPINYAPMQKLLARLEGDPIWISQRLLYLVCPSKLWA